FARFARAPATSPLPPPMAAAASARVLKKRAAHSHRSSRTRDPSDMAPPLPAAYGPRAAPGMRIMGTAAPPKPSFVQSTMLARLATRPPDVPARRVAAAQTNEPHAAVGSRHAFPIHRHHPAGLLPPVLQAIEAEVGDAGCVGNAGDADDAAHLSVSPPSVGIRSRNIAA